MNERPACGWLRQRSKHACRPGSPKVRGLAPARRRSHVPRRAETGRIASYGNHEIVLVKSRLGECLTRQNRFDEAEPLVVESFPKLEDTYGSRDP
jgi:hypothetical protein